ncbi:antitoxin [Bartonella sp. DGB2]|uniref:antitoxin VbhA family protein n=1 Tax=Bartonella sp. DGB2 TaxID=3388426 RepID=UPI00399025CC
MMHHKVTEQELKARRRNVDNAIASQRLEGLEVDPVTTAELYKFAAGELELHEIEHSIRSRIASRKL